MAYTEKDNESMSYSEKEYLIYMYEVHGREGIFEALTSNEKDDEEE